MEKPSLVDTRGFLLGKSWLRYITSKSFRISTTKNIVNYGFSGVGRLPKLSRSFFQLLFIQNKLTDFKNLKSHFMLFNLASFINFNNNFFNKKSNFSIFWGNFLNKSFTSKKNLKYFIFFYPKTNLFFLIIIILFIILKLVF